MTIKRRLILGLGGISVLLIALGGAATWTVLALKTQIAKEIAEDKLLLGLANDGRAVPRPRVRRAAGSRRFAAAWR